MVTNLKIALKRANTMVNGDNNNVIVLKRTVLTKALTQQFKGTVIKARRHYAFRQTTLQVSTSAK